MLRPEHGAKAAFADVVQVGEFAVRDHRERAGQTAQIHAATLIHAERSER